MTELEFLDIRTQLLKGNNDALKFVFEDYGSFCISNLIYKNKCTKEEANDIFIDAILNLREKIISSKLKEIKSLKNYLYGTCQNMFREKLKKDKKMQIVGDEIKRNHEAEQGDIFMTDDSNKEKLTICKKALLSLGEKCQTIIKMYYLMNLTMSEIATELDFSSANVAKTSKSRCYKKWMEEVNILMKQKQS